MNTLMVLAEAGQQAQGTGLGSGMGGILPMLAIMFALMYFMMIRPQQRKEKERAKMISELRAGERIMFAGGLVGTVTEVREHTFLVEVAHKVNVEVARGAVLRVLTKDEAPSLDETRK